MSTQPAPRPRSPGTDHHVAQFARGRQNTRRRAYALLPSVIRLTAVGYLVFFIPDFLLETTDRAASLPPVLARVFLWGTAGGPVAVMFSTVYIVWALFLFAAARAPLASRLFLDFNLAANSAHFTAMLIMAISMRAEHHHIASVIALGVLTTVPLAACWLPVRRLATPRDVDDRSRDAETVAPQHCYAANTASGRTITMRRAPCDWACSHSSTTSASTPPTSP